MLLSQGSHGAGGGGSHIDLRTTGICKTISLTFDTIFTACICMIFCAVSFTSYIFVVFFQLFEIGSLELTLFLFCLFLTDLTL